MLVLETKKQLRKELSSLPSSNSLGFVPTMGALHKGHGSLIERASRENQNVVVSIFVNPTQFNNGSDLEKYPKNLEQDVTFIKSIAPEALVFAPAVSEMYDEAVVSRNYDFNGLDKVMEGEFRDGHFNGVGTIVENLLNLVRPTNAYFGEKDFQQLRIVQKLVEIRQIPVNIVGCPIVRESNGLAMSSRNERLSPEIRQKAGFIYQTLTTAKEKFGTESVPEIREWVTSEFSKNMDFDLEYFEIADTLTLTPALKKNKTMKYRAFIAVYAQNVRLIDNIALN